MRYFFLTLFYLVILMPASAQIEWVPKAGVNFTNLNVENNLYESNEVTLGFHAGLDARVGSGKFFLKPGIHYYRTRAEIEYGGDMTDMEDDFVELSSLKVPLNAAYFLSSPQQAVRLSVNGGLVPTILAGVSENNLGLGEDDFQNVGIGAQLGINVDLINFTFDFKYEMGMTNLYETVDGNNRLVSMSLGYIF